jgi:hypothetical protein
MYFLTTDKYSCLAVDDNPEITNPPQNLSNAATDDISGPTKPPPSPPLITVQSVLDFVALHNDTIFTK